LSCFSDRIPRTGEPSANDGNGTARTFTSGASFQLHDDAKIDLSILPETDKAVHLRQVIFVRDSAAR
jgi:hypothetical protein